MQQALMDYLWMVVFRIPLQPLSDKLAMILTIEQFLLFPKSRVVQTSIFQHDYDFLLDFTNDFLDFLFFLLSFHQQYNIMN